MSFLIGNGMFWRVNQNFGNLALSKNVKNCGLTTVVGWESLKSLTGKEICLKSGESCYFLRKDKHFPPAGVTMNHTQ